MLARSQQAAQDVPPYALQADLVDAPAPRSADGFRPLDVLAKELDLALAAEVGLAGGTLLDGGLTLLVSEAGRTREALQRLFDETMQRYEARHQNALRQHMRYVSEVLQRRAITPRGKTGDSPKRSPRQDRPSLRRKFSPRFSAKSPRKTECSARRDKGNKMTMGPHSDRSSSARAPLQREPAVDYQEHFNDFSFGDTPGRVRAMRASPLQSGHTNVVAEERPWKLPEHGSSLKDEICKEVRDVLQAGVQQLVRAQALAGDEMQACVKDSQAKLQASMQQSMQMQVEMHRAMQVASTRQQLQPQDRRSRTMLEVAGSPGCSIGFQADTARAASVSNVLAGEDHQMQRLSSDTIQHDWRKWVYAHHDHHILNSFEAKVARLPSGRLKRMGEWAFSTIVYIMDVEEPPRTGRLASCVLSTWFELLCVSMISCNVVLTIAVLEGDMWNLREGRGKVHNWTVVWIEGTFLLWYLIELSMKLKVHQKFFFTGRDALWNAFDVVLILFSAIDLATLLLAQLQSGPDVPVEMRIVRITKLGRVLRALTAVKFFEDLRVMLDLVVASVVSIFWAVLMIGIVIGMFSLIVMQGVVHHLQEFPAELPSFQLFESVPSCMLSLLFSVTGGIDWIEPYTTMTKLGSGYSILFVFYVLFFLLVLLNIVTSVFLDRVMKFAEVSAETLVDEKSRLEASDIRQLELLFRKVDIDSSGGISLEEFKKCVASKEFGTFLAARGIDIKEAAAFFELLSHRSGAGEVHVMDMVRSCARLKGNASSVDLQILRHEINSRYRHIQEVLQSLAASANVNLPSVAESVESPQSQPQPIDPFHSQEASHEGN